MNKSQSPAQPKELSPNNIAKAIISIMCAKALSPRGMNLPVETIKDFYNRTKDNIFDGKMSEAKYLSRYVDEDKPMLTSITLEALEKFEEGLTRGIAKDIEQQGDNFNGLQLKTYGRDIYPEWLKDLIDTDMQNDGVEFHNFFCREGYVYIKIFPDGEIFYGRHDTMVRLHCYEGKPKGALPFIEARTYFENPKSRGEELLDKFNACGENLYRFNLGEYVPVLVPNRGAMHAPERQFGTITEKIQSIQKELDGFPVEALQGNAESLDRYDTFKLKRKINQKHLLSSLKQVWEENIGLEYDPDQSIVFMPKSWLNELPSDYFKNMKSLRKIGLDYDNIITVNPYEIYDQNISLTFQNSLQLSVSSFVKKAADYGIGPHHPLKDLDIPGFSMDMDVVFQGSSDGSFSLQTQPFYAIAADRDFRTFVDERLIHARKGENYFIIRPWIEETSKEQRHCHEIGGLPKKLVPYLSKVTNPEAALEDLRKNPVFDLYL